MVSAVVCTVVYGTFFLTGIILMGVGLGCLAALYDMIYFTAFLYTGSILFALSLLFFLGAGAFWAFWGIAQHLKKNGYEARPFVETPRERERDRDELSYLSCKIGLSISFH